MQKRWAVIGASGLVGNALYHELEKRKELVVGTYYSNPFTGGTFLDIESHDHVNMFVDSIRSNTTFVPAAIAHVDRCETDKHTHKVNVKDTSYLVQALNKAGSKVVFFSSGYVFDGTKGSYIPEDYPNPINLYGVQKVKTELATIASSPDNLIVRTIGVFGKELARKNFAYQVHDALVAKRTIYVPDDQWMSPIHATDLANLSINASNNVRGIVHIVGNYSLTKYTFAVEVARMFGLSDEYIVGLSSEKMRQKAQRPKMCILSHGQRSAYSLPYPDFIDGLRKFRNEM